MNNIQNFPATKFPLALDSFKSNQDSRNSREIIGEAGLSGCCPIARSIKTLCGEEVKVLRKVSSIGGHNYDNPKWVTRFIDKVDNINLPEILLVLKKH